jgi:hypothetical protein
MPVEKSLLIECPSCGIENLIADILSGGALICNQCRDALLGSGLVDSHTGHSCDICGMVFLLKRETEFVVGESECQCGSSDLSPLEIDLFVSDLQSREDQDLAKDENDGGFDWCRPAPDNSSEGDYNDVFDDDPGFSK